MVPFNKQNLRRSFSVCGRYFNIYFSSEEMVDDCLQHVSYSYTLDVESMYISGSKYYYRPRTRPVATFKNFPEIILDALYKENSLVKEFSYPEFVIEKLFSGINLSDFIGMWKMAQSSGSVVFKDRFHLVVMQDEVTEEEAFQEVLEKYEPYNPFPDFFSKNKIKFNSTPDFFNKINYINLNNI